MALKLRDKQRTATLKVVLCLCLVAISNILIFTASTYAIENSPNDSYDLTDQAVFPDGKGPGYDQYSQYNARGWKYVSAETKNGPDTWDSNESPHGDYSANSNKCRVCHGLHQANEDSFRILFNSSRKTECDRCHDPVTGLSGKKPYRLFSGYHNEKGDKDYNREDSGKAPEMITLVNGKRVILRDQDYRLIEQRIGDLEPLKGINEKPISKNDRVINLLPSIKTILDAKGEHSIGARKIPDSNIDLPTVFEEDGLVCYACHDPHFSPLNTIQTIPRWKKRGLLKDPGENGGNAEDGVISVQPYDSYNKPIDKASTNPTVAEVKSAFCADCHNKNVSWDSGVTSNDNRPNEYAHPIGNVDGSVNVYGQRKRVANDWAVEQVSQKGCLGCHAASTETDENGKYTGISSFPHQSRGHKLLFDDYTTESTELSSGHFGGYTGDPHRPLPGLDIGAMTANGEGERYPGVCRRCHANVGEESPDGF